MNVYERMAYQKNRTEDDYKSIAQRYAENRDEDAIDVYIKVHKHMLDSLKKRGEIVLTDKQLDAIVEKILKKII